MKTLCVLLAVVSGNALIVLFFYGAGRKRHLDYLKANELDEIEELERMARR